MTEISFSLVPVWQIIWAWRKRIILFVTMVTVATMVAVFFVPKYYVSAVLAIPGNPFLADKGHLFNDNIQGLYSPYGSTDELERLNGIAELDTVYKTIIAEYNIINYYKFPKDDIAKSLYKAIKALREDLRIQQTDKGQLKIMMWHKDPATAAAIANRVADMVQQIAMAMQVQYNQQSLTNLNTAITSLAQDTVLKGVAVSYSSTADQIIRYKKMINELQLAVADNPKALIVQEQAYASGKEDRPKKLPIVATVFFLSLLFAVLTALFYNRKNSNATAI